MILTLALKKTILPLDPPNLDFSFLSLVKSPSSKSSYLRALHGWNQPFIAQLTPQVSCVGFRKDSEVWFYMHQSV